MIERKRGFVTNFWTLCLSSFIAEVIIIETLSPTYLTYGASFSFQVKKTWRASHVECSAKHNWNVVAVFKELAVTLDMIANGQVIGGALQETRKKRCLMF